MGGGRADSVRGRADSVRGRRFLAPSPASQEIVSSASRKLEKEEREREREKKTRKRRQRESQIVVNHTLIMQHLKLML